MNVLLEQQERAQGRAVIGLSAADRTVSNVQYSAEDVLMLQAIELEKVERLRRMKKRDKSGKRQVKTVTVDDPEKGARASRTLRLDARFSQFCARVALSDASMGTGRLARGVVFEIIGDGALLWKSKVIHEAREVDQVRLSVFSVEQLQLCVRAASKAECDAAASAALESSEGALPDKDAESLKDGDGVDVLPLAAAGCLWFSS